MTAAVYLLRLVAGARTPCHLYSNTTQQEHASIISSPALTTLWCISLLTTGDSAAQVELIDGCLEGVVGDEGLVAQLAVGLGTGAVPVLIGMYVCMGWMDRWMDG